MSVHDKNELPKSVGREGVMTDGGPHEVAFLANRRAYACVERRWGSGDGLASAGGTDRETFHPI